MFKKIWPNEIINSDGFSIKRTDRHHIEYREGEKRLLIEVESGNGLAIYPQTIKSWEPPFQSEIITKEKSEKIMHNIILAFDFAEWKYVIG